MNSEIELPVTEEHSEAETCDAEEKQRVSRNHISWSKVVVIANTSSSPVLERHFFFILAKKSSNSTSSQMQNQRFV